MRAQERAADARAADEAHAVADVLATELEAITAPADAIKSLIIAKRGAPVPEDLQTFALELLKEGNAEGFPLKSLSIAPGNVIEAVWPLQGNEAAIGLNLAATPAQWDPIKDRIAAGQPVLTGPVDLVEGGRAFIYRVPVVLEDGTYWGLSSAIVDYDTVAEMVKTAAPGAEVSIRSSSPSGDVVDLFGRPEVADPQVVDFPVPGASWQAAVASQPYRAGVAGPIGAVSVVLSCVLSALAYWVIGLRQRAADRRYQNLFQASADALLMVDPDGRIALANAHAGQMFGYSAQELTGTGIEMLLPPRLRDGYAAERMIFNTDPSARRMGMGLPLRGLRRDGSEIPVEISLSPVGEGPDGPVLAAIRDVTERDSLIDQLRQANERLGDLAERDPLTGVFNRRGFLDHVQAALADPPGQAASIGVLFVDLDAFKAVNDVYGHPVGDALLRAVADRLVQNTRPEGGRAGRLGGDEFAVLLAGCEPSQLDAVARRLERCVREPIIIAGVTLALSCTVGQGLGTAGGGVDAEGLLALADADMYAVRRARRQGLAARVEQVRHGLDAGQFLTYFQPVWALGPAGPTLHGYEALIRWQHPERGLVPPDEFIATAEEGGLITRLDMWAATEALRQLAGRPEISIAVNFSALSLTSPGTVHQLIAAITASGRDPTSVIVELTESVDIPDNSQIMTSLNRLRHEGIRIALDDFGAGYAGLNNLRRLGIDIVKIDRSLIATLAEDTAQADNTEHFLTGIRQLTHAMDTQLLAEGIETTRQLDLVRKLGFDYAQGFLLGKPTPQP